MIETNHSEIGRGDKINNYVRIRSSVGCQLVSW